MVDCLPACLVHGHPVLLEQGLDFVKQRLLRCIIRGTELRGALEHKVLEVMGETCGLGRVILAPDLHCDVGLDARGLLVDGHEHFQTVVKGVNFGVLRIVLDGLVLRTAGAERCNADCHKRDELD